MTDDLLALKTETEAALAAATDLRAWDAVRVGVLGRSGTLTALLRDLGKAPPDQRRERGTALNQLHDALTAAIEARRRHWKPWRWTPSSPPNGSIRRCRRARRRPD